MSDLEYQGENFPVTENMTTLEDIAEEFKKSRGGKSLEIFIQRYGVRLLALALIWKERANISSQESCSMNWTGVTEGEIRQKIAELRGKDVDNG